MRSFRPISSTILLRSITLYLLFTLSIDNSFANDSASKTQWDQHYSNARSQYIDDIDGAISEALKAEEIGFELKDVTLIGKSQWMAGWLYRRKGDLVNAFNYYLGAKKSFARLKDWEKVEQLEENLGSVALDSRSYDVAIARWNERLTTAKRLGRKREAFANYDLGLAHYYNKDYDVAMDYLLRAKAIFFNGYYESDDNTDVARLLNLIGLIYSKDIDGEIGASYDSAKFYFNEALSFDSNSLMQAMINNNLGLINLKAKVYDKSEDHYLRAAELNLANNNLRYLITNYVALGELYAATNKLEQSLDYIVMVFDLDYNTVAQNDRDLNRALESDMTDYILRAVSLLDSIKVSDPVFLAKNNDVVLDAFKKLTLSVSQLEDKNTSDLIAVAYSDYEREMREEIFWAAVKFWIVLIVGITIALLFIYIMVRRRLLMREVARKINEQRRAAEEIVSKY